MAVGSTGGDSVHSLSVSSPISKRGCSSSIITI